MRTQRREFSIAVLLEIVRRATDSSDRIHCEQCGVWLKSRPEWEIDHIISEGIRPAADKQRRLTPADGRLLCKAVCHSSKTKRDIADIAEAKRREAADHGLKRPGKEKPPEEAAENRRWAARSYAEVPMRRGQAGQGPAGHGAARHGRHGKARLFSMGALALVTATEPAMACHHYKYWAMGYPQHCHASATRVLREAPARSVAVPSAPVAPIKWEKPTVEFPDEDAVRAIAIDALRHKLNTVEMIR